ncbi:conserved hypothetical protein [uncultured delta proteobacterium]|uniref:Glycosyltransferase n=1 Tax=uncultured delta proteobacterium TaxID=34034 RepID=A0A212JZW5_9DELT|nr:conserved hypothetical protein [uncultured delta proteobacterium]
MAVDPPLAGGTAAQVPAREDTLIVSLTSYPPKIPTLHLALETLLRQSLKPDALILWLAEEEFPGRENDLPHAVLALRDQGLSIRWTTNTRSYKKLVPALREYPESVIVTADDDALYSPEWLERLYADYRTQERKTMVYAHRVHRITVYENGTIYPYGLWSHAEHNEPGESFFNFATGVGGILYPPGALHSDVCDESLFLRLAPYADDIWFWAMALLNGSFIRVVENFIAPIKNVPLAKGVAAGTLYEYNSRGGNDEQFENVMRQYPDIAIKLLTELKILRRR